MNKKRAGIFKGTAVAVFLLLFAAYSAIPAFASDSGINEQEQVTAEAGQTAETISHEDGRRDLADREVTLGDRNTVRQIKVTLIPDTAPVTETQNSGAPGEMPTVKAVVEEINSNSIPSLTPKTMLIDSTILAQNPTPEEIEKAKAKAMQEYFNKWKVSVTPYWFFFNADMDIEIGDRTAGTNISYDKLSSSLDGGFNCRLDINKAHWGGFVDVSDLKFSKTSSARFLSSSMQFESRISHYCFYYRFSGVPVFDIYGGVRTFQFDTSIRLQPQRFPIGLVPGHTVAGSTSWTDPIIGARMMAPLSKNIIVLVGGDCGGLSDTHNSYAVYGLLSWALSHNISINGGYNMMGFEYRKSGALADNIKLKCRLNGPMLSIGINF